LPTYQYACTACGERLDAVQSFTDEPLTECPACAGRLRKLYSAVGVVFKGSGFYRTDSRAAAAAAASGSGSKSAGAGKSAEAATTSSGDTKTETKSETKSTTDKAPSTSTTSTASTPSTA
jgi:putative FmdB family regulatory protein